MRRSRRKSTALVLVAVLALSMGAASCGGGGDGGSPDLVLVGFNVPNIGGVALNQPLMFTFSADVDPNSITPDTLRVTGALGPNFETTVVDGNLVALLPRSPNFEDYSDAGLLPSVRYTVDFATFPRTGHDPHSGGKPLLAAESFQFDTDKDPKFIETRRPIHQGAPPGDGLGCLNNSTNSLDTTQQFGSGPGARLLCLKNEGRPQVVWDECSPQQGDEAVGTPAINPGLVNLPALRARFNEPLDPTTVVPWSTSTKWSENIQLWLVGDTEKRPLASFEQTRVNKPLIVQSLEQTEIILVAANEDALGERVGGVKQGTYLINITRNVHDLNGNETAIDESLPPGSFQAIDDAVSQSTDIPSGYRIYFVSLVVPGTRQSIIENFETNGAEWGDLDSEDEEPGTFTYSDVGVSPNDPLARIPGSIIDPPGAAAPSFTLTPSWPGQSTVGNWNGAYRLWNIETLEADPDASQAAGALQAVWKPHCGGGDDGAWESRPVSQTTPVERTLATTPGAGASVDGDGIYEYRSFILRANDKLFVNGSQPLVILCRGDFTIEAGAQIILNGGNGAAGLDTDGTFIYTNPGAIRVGGRGGAGGAGGGAGGVGADPINDSALTGGAGTSWAGIFGNGPGTGAGNGGSASPSGGGGGGLSSNGQAGTFTDGSTDGTTPGTQSNDIFFRRPLAAFEPDRGYNPYANGSGGCGAGGGGANDQGTADTAENGDDGGGGGGGAGGGIYVVCCGDLVVNGDILANGGDGGSVYARADQIISDPDEDTANDEFVAGVNQSATPSGAGGPGGGGTGGGIFLCGMQSLTIGSTATVAANGGSGGTSGATDPVNGLGTELIGGNASAGIIVLASASSADVTVSGSVSPSEQTVEYHPTVEYDSVGQSKWYDLFTDTTEYVGFRWDSNFPNLNAVGLTQGVDFDAYLEVQGASSLLPSPGDGAPTEAQGLTPWFVLNSNDWTENRVDFDPTLNPSPINGKRFFRYRWRFHVPESYPGWAGGIETAQSMPQVQSLTIEYER